MSECDPKFPSRFFFFFFFLTNEVKNAQRSQTNRLSAHGILWAEPLWFIPAVSPDVAYMLALLGQEGVSSSRTSCRENSANVFWGCCTLVWYGWTCCGSSWVRRRPAVWMSSQSLSWVAIDPLVCWANREVEDRGGEAGHKASEAAIWRSSLFVVLLCAGLLLTSPLHTSCCGSLITEHLWSQWAFFSFFFFLVLISFSPLPALSETLQWAADNAHSTRRDALTAV